MYLALCMISMDVLHRPLLFVIVYKQKTAYDMRISDWSSDVCSSDLPEVSIPGSGIIVTGRRNRNPERSSTQVLSVLSSEDIARTGEGDIAGALGARKSVV